MELNKVEDEQSSPGRHTHLSQSIGQFHQELALSHMQMTAIQKKLSISQEPNTIQMQKKKSKEQ